jgi:hypothetical protein
VFPFPKKRSDRPPWPTLVVLIGLLFLYELYAWQTRRQEGGRFVTRLDAPRKSPDASARAGDLVLSSPEGASITIVAAPNVAGHRPLLGAIVDVATEPGDVSDPLVWFRTKVSGGPPGRDGGAELPVRSPQPFDCEGGGSGVRSYGGFGVLGLTEEICAGRGRVFFLRTTLTSLPDGAAIADEINVGSLPVVVSHDGAAWDAEHDTTFLAFAHGGTAVLLEADTMHVSRTFSHFGAEVFPSPVLATYGHQETARRTLHVVRGDVLHALAELRAAPRLLEVTFGVDQGGDVSIRDDAGRELGTGHVARGETRMLRLPPDFGTIAVLRDDRGVVTDDHVPLPAPGGRASVRAAVASAGTVTLSYRDDRGALLPVHVLFKGPPFSDDPTPVSAVGEKGRTVAAGRSLYLLDGHTRLSLAPGPYHVTASHGPAWSLSERDVIVTATEPVVVEDTLRAVVDTSAWVAADFHLHSAPSPDSTVTLDERVSSLVSEGVDLAVATDHNHITDFAPHVHSLAVGDRIATLPGVEMTSGGQRWGHFNAYPLPMPSGAPEDGVPVYYDKRPAEMFSSARALGARVIQVNHARMDPGIGYFDLAHLDSKTGHSDPVFSSDFDVLEAYNGLWIESYQKVREGPLDVVALARRGKRVAVTGNSDSHRLLYEEAGYPRTYVHVSREPVGTRAERTLAALPGGDTMVTSGPFVEVDVDGHGPGSVVVPGAGGSVRVHIRVSAPAWVPVENVEIWRDDVVALRTVVPGPPLDGLRFEREMELPIAGRDAVVTAWAEAGTPLPDVVPYERALAIGFTGPIYVDGDHDGRILVPAAP